MILSRRVRVLARVVDGDRVHPAGGVRFGLPDSDHDMGWSSFQVYAVVGSHWPAGVWGGCGQLVVAYVGAGGIRMTPDTTFRVSSHPLVVGAC